MKDATQDALPMMKPSVFEKWHPVTHDFGLIEAPLEAVAEAYQAWWIDVAGGVEVQSCSGTLNEKFGKLEPLSNATNRALLLPTASVWTAFFRNGILGSDPSSAMPILAKQLNVRAMRICLTPEKAK